MYEDFNWIEKQIDIIFNPPVGWKNASGKTNNITVARQTARWFLYYHTNIATTDIMYSFGTKNSCGIFSSLNSVNDKIRIDYLFACKIVELLKQARGNGYKLLHPYGRNIPEHGESKYVFPQKFADSPKERKSKYEELNSVDSDRIIDLLRRVSALEIELRKLKQVDVL